LSRCVVSKFVTLQIITFSCPCRLLVRNANIEPAADMDEDENSMAQNRSMLRDFLGSIGTMKGDLSNITAPPFVLDTKSAVELPQYWAEVPSVFIAPTLQDSAEKRALYVLRWFLSSLRNQQYAGHTEKEGVKKPLNAFLGELFIAHWDDECGRTELVTEQVR